MLAGLRRPCLRASEAVKGTPFAPGWQAGQTSQHYDQQHLPVGVAQRKHRTAAAMTQLRQFVTRDSRHLDEAPLTVVSWNILADQFAVLQFDSACPPQHLDWSSRLPRIVKQLLSYDADVICLQEVCRFSWRAYVCMRRRRAACMHDRLGLAITTFMRTSICSLEDDDLANGSEHCIVLAISCTTYQ